MFYTEKASLADMSDEKRKVLLEYGMVREERLPQLLMLTRLRNIALSDPTPENLARLEDAEEAVSLTGMSLRTAEALSNVWKEGVDVEKLTALLPTILAAVLSAVDLPYILMTLETDQAAVDNLLSSIKDFLESGRA